MCAYPDLAGSASIADGVLAGDARCLARAISWLENGREGVLDVMRRVHPYAGSARVLGITGPPGAGKSTLSDAVVSRLRERGKKAGLLLIDPASPLTGGAILGDRVRLPDHAGDPGVFIRSMSNRGHLGGLSPAAAGAAALIGAAGFDWVIVETVGTGQAETDIAALADTVLLVLVPGLGDDIQLMKAGIMEIADIFVVNKSDREGAARLAGELRALLTHKDEWIPEIVSTVAISGQGVDDLLSAVERHAAHLTDSGYLEAVRAKRRRAQFQGALRAAFDRAAARVLAGPAESVIREVEAGTVDPYTAAMDVWRDLSGDARSAF